MPLRGGWEGGGVPTPRGTLRGSEDQGRQGRCFSHLLGPGKPVGVPGWIPCPPWPPLGHVGTRGVGGRWGEKRRGGPGGPLQDQRIRVGVAGVSPAHLAWGPAGSRPGPSFSGVPSGLVGPRGMGGREEGGRGREADGGGVTLQDQKIREGAVGVSPTHSGPGKPAGLLSLVLCSLRPPPALGVLGA